MARKWLRRFGLIAGLGFVWAALAGCFLDVAYGHTVNTVTVASGDQDWGTSFSSQSAASNCTANDSIVTCNYDVNGTPAASTAYYVGPEGGLAEVLDPLILEVPDNVMSTTGTYDTGGGSLPLLIRQTDSFPVEPNHRITAEVNTIFLILSIPRSVTDHLPTGNPSAGPVFSYTLSFHQVYPLTATVPALTVKPLQAGEVTVLWQTYYIPLLPCIYDYQADPFAAIPPITIPKASSPQDLSPMLGDLLRHGAVSPCHFAVYNYTFATPPPGLVFLPLMTVYSSEP